MRRFRRVATAAAILVLGVQGYSAMTPHAAAAADCYVNYITNPYVTDGPAVESSSQVKCNFAVVQIDVEVRIWRHNGGTSYTLRVDHTYSCQYQPTSCVSVATTGHCTSSTNTTYHADVRFREPGPTWPWSGYSYSGNQTLACYV